MRAEGSVGALTQAVQQAVWSVDPTQPVSDVRLMREVVERSLGPQTFNTVLLGTSRASRCCSRRLDCTG